MQSAHTHTHRHTQREGERASEQKQPPSDVFFQILGGVPFAAGLELEGVGVDGGLGAVKRQL